MPDHTARARRLRAPLIATGYTLYGCILVLGNLPGWRSDVGHFAPGYMLHSVAYGSLSLVFYLGLYATPLARIRFAMMTVALMGAGDELLQRCFPYRHASVSDWGVDVSAALVTTLSMALIESWRPGLNWRSPALVAQVDRKKSAAR